VTSTTNHTLLGARLTIQAGDDQTSLEIDEPDRSVGPNQPAALKASRMSGLWYVSVILMLMAASAPTHTGARNTEQAEVHHHREQPDQDARSERVVVQRRDVLDEPWAGGCLESSQAPGE
jgi:hypothetical protein